MRALVENRKGILSQTKLPLGPIQLLASLSRRQGSSINTPLRSAPLTPLPSHKAEVHMALHEKTLEIADDVIYGTYPMQRYGDPSQSSVIHLKWR
jgi:hypothetical protein